MHDFLNLIDAPTIVAGSVSFLVALLLVLTQNWHGYLTMDSNKGVQKFHTQPTPRVGGIAILFGIIAGYLMAPETIQSLLAPLVMAGIPAFTFGLLEDLTKQVSVRVRLFSTMACSVVGWLLTGYSITLTNVPAFDWILSFTFFSVMFTAFAVGGVANAINIVDGFNGLAAGTLIIVLWAFNVMANTVGDQDLAQTCMILTGTIIGFFLLNWPFGKIFLGDGGAYFLGFATAWMAVLILQQHTEVSAWAPMLACAYPILEVGFSFVRKSQREGHHPGQADRVHLHMLLNRRVARKNYPLASGTLQNGLTSLFVWPCAFFPALWAVIFYDSATVLALGFIVSIVLYRVIYMRLTQFRWCWNAVTLRSKKGVVHDVSHAI